MQFTLDITRLEKGKTLLEKIKNVYTTNRRLILIALIHFGLLFCALILAYNSYKEVGTHLRGKYFLSHTIKKDIKATFLPTSVVFAVLYLLCSVIRGRQKSYLTLREYFILFILLTLISNLIFFSKGPRVLIVLNLSFFYLAVFLFLFATFAKVLLNIIEAGPELFLPPILYKSLTNNLARARNYFQEKPSAPFILASIGLLATCALSLALSLKGVAEVGATVAYFALVIGLGIELYILITSGNGDEKERN